MAKIVRDWCGDPLELRLAQGEDAARPSARVIGVAQNRDNHVAMLHALADAGRVRLEFAETLTFDEVRTLVERALADGLLPLGRVKEPRPPGSIIDVDPPDPLVPGEDDDDVVTETHTLELELQDPEGKPVPSAAYRVKLPDGEIRTGNLNAQGKAALAGIKKAGSCEVTFTQYDQDAWVPA